MKGRIKSFVLFYLILLISISMIGASVPSIKVFNTDEQIEKENYKDKKIIYLTFDDGPSYKITDAVLDILKEKDVKATFFLIGNQIEDREDVVKRIHDEGHGIGLHTFTHKFKVIYSSDDNFIKEMIKCREEINRVIGISPNIIRFPGGSYKHLNKNLLKRLHDNNFRIYDWNVDNTDGMNPKLSSSEIYKKSIKGSEKLHPVILLMHCTDMNKNTCKALPDIIDYYKNNGYEFRVIDKDTPEMHFRIR